MSFSIADARNIVVDDLRIVDGTEWDETCSEVLNVNPAAEPEDILRTLGKKTTRIGRVNRPLVSEFQAEAILNPPDRGKSLVLGDSPKYVLLDHPSGWSGGAGTVYKAIEQNAGSKDELVAVKKINFPTHPEEQKRLEVEVSILCSRRRGNASAYVVRGKKHFRIASDYWLVMEMCHGETIHDLVKRLEQSGKRLTLRQVLELTDSALIGLDWLHSNQLVHRDIKPKNMIVRKYRNRNVTRIVDLGMVKKLDKPITLPNFVAGTVFYMAPECYSRAENATFSADIYGLACVIYYMLTGEPPNFAMFLRFRIPTPPHIVEDIAMLQREQNELTSRAIHKIRRNLPPRLTSLLLSSLHPDSTQRIQNVQQFRQEFNPLKEELEDAYKQQLAFPVIRKSIQKAVQGIVDDPAVNNQPQASAEKFSRDLRNFLQQLDGNRMSDTFLGASEFNVELEKFVTTFEKELDTFVNTVKTASGRDEKYQQLMIGISQIRNHLPHLLELQHLHDDQLAGLTI